MPDEVPCVFLHMKTLILFALLCQTVVSYFHWRCDWWGAAKLKNHGHVFSSYHNSFVQCVNFCFCCLFHLQSKQIRLVIYGLVALCNESDGFFYLKGFPLQKSILFGLSQKEKKRIVWYLWVLAQMKAANKGFVYWATHGFNQTAWSLDDSKHVSFLLLEGSLFPSLL